MSVTAACLTGAVARGRGSPWLLTAGTRTRARAAPLGAVADVPSARSKRSAAVSARSWRRAAVAVTARWQPMKIWKKCSLDEIENCGNSA